MKPTTKITALSLTTIAIVMFWLAPNVNKATDQRYTRLYEDTDIKVITRDSVKSKKIKEARVSRKERKAEKVYKEESINPNGKFSNLKSSMFSRAIQFEPKVVMDSTAVTEITDTTKVTL